MGTYTSPILQTTSTLTTFTNMIGRTVGITAACALGASALILPPGIAPEHREIVLEEGEDRAMIAEIDGEAPPQYEDSPAYEDRAMIAEIDGNIYPPTFQQ